MEKQSNGMGVALGMILCALILLGFPKFAEVADWAAWIFYGVGLVALLIGCLGACIEAFK